MSVVTTLVLVTSLGPFDRSDAQIAAQSEEAFIVERCPSLVGLKDIGHYFGGGKAPQVEAFAGAFNYLNHAEVLAELALLPWGEDAVAQIVVNGEEDHGVQCLTVVGTPETRPFIEGVS